ncbi:MAG TPA: tyrosine--tRNA ligase [Candidatus Ruthenibacterium merdavium]|uniref:Tyrosine--tRNA ligase n=1 Tax=Candidatus Ruthenibacterium merdavium TaxID=2838752 RepID=A0A9D2Q4Q9_9FIRM|nr:tyrosine--tRNA ligase [Candidatus Ruthenibacterium merdavium]
MENVFDWLKERGLVAQATNEEEIRTLLGKEKVTFYTGFDPTADSLHVGHFMQLIVMRKMQQAGHRPIVLLGGGTTMVGDPTGKTDMRKMLTKEQIQHNADCFKTQMSKFIDFSEGKALMVNNADWLLDLNYLEFLREIGVHFSVNKMLTAECFKTRLEKGLSFIEFNYMLMQSYDFLHLARDYGCKMEFGGNDQWSNIIGGVELNRRCDQREVYGMTFTLLTTREGKKMGKTEKGAVWLDPEKTSPYEFYQYWRNIDDAEVQNCLKLLTDVPVAEIDAIDMTSGPAINAAKERLAFELTSLVHSPEEAQKAMDTARSLFGGGADAADMPSTVLDPALVGETGIGILDLLTAAGLVPSKGEGRRLIQQGGIALEGEKVTDPMSVVSRDRLEQGVVVKKGKKVYHKVSL